MSDDQILEEYNFEVSFEDKPADHPSRTIPERIKKAVREKCAYGCIFCGLPIFDYDHVEEWSSDKVHLEENIILLCPNHHALKTRKSGWLSKEAIRHRAQNPFNKSQEHTPFWPIEQAGSTFTFDLGGVELTSSLDKLPNSEFIAIELDDRNLLSVRAENGFLLPTAVFYEANRNAPILAILDGQFTINTSCSFNRVGSRIEIRNSKKKKLLDIRLFNGKLEVNIGTTLHNNFFCFIDRDSVGIEIQHLDHSSTPPEWRLLKQLKSGLFKDLYKGISYNETGGAIGVSAPPLSGPSA
jgi:hypothetical protein